MPPTKRIIIIGGGFAGVRCARTLRRGLSPGEAEIVLFNRENHMVFHPLLAEVAGASLDADAVIAPLRQMLPGVRCRTEQVRDIDLESSEVIHEADDSALARLTYDHVVVACGNVVNLGMVPGMADHAFPLKTIGDAIALRTHVIEQMERAEVCPDPVRRRSLLSFIVVGGGFSGVEVAGEINDLVRGSLRYFSNIPRDGISVTLVHSRDRLLPEIGAELRDLARVQMEKAGINVALNSSVAYATARGVGLKDGRFIEGSTVVCTIGTAVAAMIERLKAPKEGGRLLTEPDMRLRGRVNAWAVGDAARIINGIDGHPSPPTGQFAERQGHQAALNIIRVIRGGDTRPFAFKKIGQLCSIGGHRAVAEVFGFRMSGFIAWFVWRGVYLFKLPSLARRIKVGFDWAWQLFFARDLANIRINQTERVSRAFYKPGDAVFHEGDPAASFYVIEHGEVEVTRTTADGEALLAVLGPGSFFGEAALLSNQPRNATVRARTDAEVIVMGREVFSQVSNSLAPLRDLLTHAMTRRSTGLWHRLPKAGSVLRCAPIRELVRPAPMPLLDPSASFEEAVRLMDEGDHDFLYAVDGGGGLVGIITRSDVFRALERPEISGLSVRDVMTPEPTVITLDDDCMTAAATMRDRNFKWLPVVRSKDGRELAGYIRAQSLISRVLGDTGEG